MKYFLIKTRLGYPQKHKARICEPYTSCNTVSRKGGHYRISLFVVQRRYRS